MSQQNYLQYVDSTTSVVKKPEGDGWTDPFGDGVWRSSWFYASLLVFRGKDNSTYTSLASKHLIDLQPLVHGFLSYFLSNCTQGDEWQIPKNPTQKFSGDQLAPLLYLLATVHAYSDGPTRIVAEQILKNLIDLDGRKAAVSDSHGGQIRDNQRYAIDVVCRMYGIRYLDGVRRDLCKLQFSIAHTANNAIAQAPSASIATMGSYAVFNALGLVSACCIKWGSADKDVGDWRKNYRLHADKGWGPAFDIVSGRSYAMADIAAYDGAFVSRDLDNDIVMAQRPEKYLSNVFGVPDTSPGVNKWLALDHAILMGLHHVWA